MPSNDYSKTLNLKTTPKTVYRALTQDIQSWWSKDIMIKNDVFTIGFGETKKTFKVENSALTEKGDEVIWQCIGANLMHPDVSNPSEWVGTHILWSIQPDGDGTKVTLTHEGLNEGLQCFDICVRGWDYFFVESLKEYLETGQGKPFSPAQAA